MHGVNLIWGHHCCFLLLNITGGLTIIPAVGKQEGESACGQLYLPSEGEGQGHVPPCRETLNFRTYSTQDSIGEKTVCQTQQRAFFLCSLVWSLRPRNFKLPSLFSGAKPEKGSGSMSGMFHRHGLTGPDKCLKLSKHQ